MSDLPKHWRWATLGSVATVNPRMSKSDLSDDCEVSFVPMAAVSEESGRMDTSDIRLAGDLKGTSYRQFADGDVLVAKITPSMENGKAAVARHLAGGRGFGSTEFHVLRPSPVVKADFLLYFALQRSFRADAARNMTGTAGQLRVPSDYLRNHPIPLPPLAEQERIVAAIEEYFSHLDAAEASVERARRNGDLVLRSSVHQLFADASWEWTTLGEIAELRGGVTKDGKRHGDPSFVEVPYLRVANVQRGRLDLREVATIRVSAEKAKSLRLESGDVLFNEGGDRDKLGRGWVWEGQVTDCIHQNHVFRARLKTPDFDPRFVSTHGNTWGQRWFEEHGRQTTNLASISLTTLAQFPVPRAPMVRQREIMQHLDRTGDSVTRLTSAMAVARQRAATLRRAVLAAAFSGRLATTVPAQLGTDAVVTILDPPARENVD